MNVYMQAKQGRRNESIHQPSIMAFDKKRERDYMLLLAHRDYLPIDAH